MAGKQQFWIIAAGILGFLAVSLGAFGAHGLESRLSPKMMDTYRTGVLYHLVHSVVILTLAMLGNFRFLPAAWFFLAGIVLFSFSLYAYSITGIKLLAMITPIGGICFLAGWVMIVYFAVRP